MFAQTSPTQHLTIHKVYSPHATPYLQWYWVGLRRNVQIKSSVPVPFPVLIESVCVPRDCAAGPMLSLGVNIHTWRWNALTAQALYELFMTPDSDKGFALC